MIRSAAGCVHAHACKACTTLVIKQTVPDFPINGINLYYFKQVQKERVSKANASSFLVIIMVLQCYNVKLFPYSILSRKLYRLRAKWWMCCM